MGTILSILTVVALVAVFIPGFYWMSSGAMDAGTRFPYSLTSLIGIVFAIIGFIYAGYREVGATEIAVAERFGTIVGERTPGIYIEPLTSYTYYDSKVVTVVSTQAAATSDLQDINVDLAVSFRINIANAVEIFKNTGNMEQIKYRILDPLTAQSFKSVSVKYNGQDLIQKRNDVSAEVKKLLVEKLGEYNLDVVEVSLTNMTFMNPDFNAAIDRKQIAEQETLKAQFELEKVKIEAEKQAALQQSLTPQILQKIFLEKWNGVLPTYMSQGDLQLLLGTN